MKTETTEKNGKPCGEIFYDAECPLCMKGFMRFNGLFSRYGFRWLPMQTPGLARRLGTTDEELRTEMKVLRRDGLLLGGIDTWSYMLRCVWWLWPLGAFLLLPGIHKLANDAYRWVARNRYCFGGHCALPQTQVPHLKPFELVLCAALPIAIGLLTRKTQGWIFMWSVAVAMGFVGKWLTFRDALRHGAMPTFSRFVIWFGAWPGMDGRAFFNKRLAVAKPAINEWLWTIGKLLLGLVFVVRLAPALLPESPLFAGWTVMIGVVLTLHFGIFHLLSILWRTCGIGAQPIMRLPVFATSLAEFWSVRWNTAFSIPSRRLLLVPLARKLGTIKASFLIFLLSGLLHELIISLPARGGFGLPTVYFVLQAGGIFLQNGKAARRYALDRGWRGWMFTVIFAALPAYYLFHPLFIRNVILPMLQAIGAN